MPEANSAPKSSHSDDSSGTSAPAAEAAAAAAQEAELALAQPRFTPRQARRIRIAISATVLAVVAAALMVRLSSTPSVLTVGFYGLALILSGTAIVLSRRGRTRVATAVLALGFGAVLFAEWLLSAAE